MRKWQPIETAPRDGTNILVLLNMATVWVAHIARWEGLEDTEDPEFVGWWSYVRHSVTQEMLSPPVYWMPFDEPEGYLWGMEVGPHHPSVVNK